MQRTASFSVYRDPVPKVVTWDVDTFFTVLVTPIDNSLEFEPGGSIQRFSFEVFLPKFYPDVDFNLVEQLTDGIPGEGDMFAIEGVVYRVAHILVSPEGAGWTLTLQGPDQANDS